MREALSSASADGGSAAGKGGTGGMSALQRAAADGSAIAAPSPVDLFEDAVSAALISAKAVVTSERLLGDPVSSFPLLEIDPQPLLPSHSNGQELQVNRNCGTSVSHPPCLLGESR